MICFFSEGITFNLRSKLLIKKWLKLLAANNGYTVGDVNYIFCSDDYLLEMNKLSTIGRIPRQRKSMQTSSSALIRCVQTVRNMEKVSRGNFTA